MTHKNNPNRADANNKIKPLSQYTDIYDFYMKTGMSPIEANEFLVKQLLKQI